MPPVGKLAPPAEDEEEAVALAQGQGVIFVLDDAQLEVAQVGKVRRHSGATA
jgi:rRNA small subunit pseudouridine methyltransferase Nep1